VPRSKLRAGLGISRGDLHEDVERERGERQKRQHHPLLLLVDGGHGELNLTRGSQGLCFTSLGG
jgi:hypothetical protein